MLVYGFNRDEAARSFRKAVELDPKTPMAYWGIAMARGPYVNLDGDPTYQMKESCEALDKGLAVAGIPFAIGGGLIALYLAGLDFSVSAAIGFISLFGVAVMDGILNITYFRELRAQGMDIAEVRRPNKRSYRRRQLRDQAIAPPQLGDVEAHNFRISAKRRLANRLGERNE